MVNQSAIEKSLDLKFWKNPKIFPRPSLKLEWVIFKFILLSYALKLSK